MINHTNVSAQLSVQLAGQKFSHKLVFGMVDCHHDNLARRRSDEPIFDIGGGSADRCIRDHVFLYVACKAGSPRLSISAKYIGKPGMRGWVQTRQCSLVQLLKGMKPEIGFAPEAARYPMRPVGSSKPCLTVK
ncbi:hypothetical protein [Rhizobium leguminosarum]|uniref:hypothetical protein n=1 Tax=Rhizobium leguminosarum TaxID=384 RepID=UPI001C976A1A|nr:hypothetical protein [Rhizobium leguminosarum]